ncbi:hypothetical protein [Streptomyces sp. NPDC060184]|uniref:hypothetical protein n=1 Tax=Streptomyces sp. NPDC060184 TaxID=3347064 RepID=UPI003647A147
MRSSKQPMSLDIPAMGMTGGHVAEAVDRLHRVPGRHREFVQDARRAAREHGISPALLNQLGDLGLPSQHVDGAHRYDRIDLANVALALRLPNARAMAMRGWANSLSVTAGTGSSFFEVEVEAHCPAPGHPGGCAYELSDALRSLEGYEPRDEVRSGTLRRRMPRPESAAPPHARELAELVRPLHYHLLPEALRADLGFLEETGLADCALAAAFLTREAGARGLDARYSNGIFLALPYSMTHTWMEVRDGDSWTALDPHLLHLLTDWSLLNPADWPPYRSIGGCTVRVAERDVWLVTHRGACAVLSLTTRCSPADLG